MGRSMANFQGMSFPIGGDRKHQRTWVRKGLSPEDRVRMAACSLDNPELIFRGCKAVNTTRNFMQGRKSGKGGKQVLDIWLWYQMYMCVWVAGVGVWGQERVWAWEWATRSPHYVSRPCLLISCLEKGFSIPFNINIIMRGRWSTYP